MAAPQGRRCSERNQHSASISYSLDRPLALCIVNCAAAAPPLICSGSGGSADAPSGSRKAHKQTALVAEASGVKAKHRLLVVPTKRLPDAAARRPVWAFVEEVRRKGAAE